MRNGVKSLKIASFWVITSKMFTEDLMAPLHYPTETFHAREKMNLKGRGESSKCTIYTPGFFFRSAVVLYSANLPVPDVIINAIKVHSRVLCVQ